MSTPFYKVLKYTDTGGKTYEVGCVSQDPHGWRNRQLFIDNQWLRLATDKEIEQAKVSQGEGKHTADGDAGGETPQQADAPSKPKRGRGRPKAKTTV